VPNPGQHTDEVLSGILGYSRGTLEELRQAKVIA
jgi:crotonobetainyl-CoA:carnitine CoA-transferase CaiB-like acyl-CoA transferase